MLADVHWLLPRLPPILLKTYVSFAHGMWSHYLFEAVPLREAFA